MVLGKWNSSKLGHVTRQVGLVLPDLVADGELWELHPPEVAKVLDCKVVFVRHVFHVMESLLLLTKIGPQTYRWNGYASFLPTLSALAWEMKFLDYPQHLVTIQDQELEQVLEQSLKVEAKTFQFRPQSRTQGSSGKDQTIDFPNEGSSSTQTETRHNWTIYNLSQNFIALCLHQKDRFINLDIISQVLSQGFDKAKSRIIERHIRNICHVMTSLKYPLLQRVSIGQFSDKAFQNIVRYVGPAITDLVLTPEMVAKLPLSVDQDSWLLSLVRQRMNLRQRSNRTDPTGILTTLRVKLNQMTGQHEILKSDVNRADPTINPHTIARSFSVNQEDGSCSTNTVTFDVLSPPMIWLDRSEHAQE